jgi:hypothetical protein
MTAHNGAVNHHVFVVGVARQQSENAVSSWPARLVTRSSLTGPDVENDRNRGGCILGCARGGGPRPAHVSSRLWTARRNASLPAEMAITIVRNDGHLVTALPPSLFLITQQFSLRVPDLQAVPVDYVMIWTQGFSGFERQFEGLERLHGMATVGRDAKRSV